MMGATIRTRRPVRAWVVNAAALAILATAAPGLTAQQLPLKTAPLPGAVVICGAGGGATGLAGTAVTDPDEAARLTDDATQTMILGDLTGALGLLDRALALDPAAAEAVYLRARILQEQGETEAATDALCAYLALRPDGPSALEVRRRLDEARDAGVGEHIVASYRRALALEFEGRLEEAEAAFTDVLATRPGAGIALYNRGVVRAALGRTDAARADLERYLQLDPPPTDASDVRRFLASVPSPADPTDPAEPARVARPTTTAEAAGPRSGTAFAVGALLPGGGQYYTGRTGLGVAVTALAGGAIATGLLYKRTTVYCRDVTIVVDCPEEDVSDRITSRPLLGAAVVAAAGLMLGAAIEASVHASRRSSGQAAAEPADAGAPRLGFSGDVRYDGAAVHVDLIRLRF